MNAVCVAPDHLAGAEGELISICITVEPRDLEALLDTISQAPFPVNPEIHHGRPTAVEFPAYEGSLKDVRRLLTAAGFPARALQVSRFL